MDTGAAREIDALDSGGRERAAFENIYDNCEWILIGVKQLQQNKFCYMQATH